jgi:hypothetical protein
MSKPFTAENLEAALKLAAVGLPIFPAIITWNETAQKNDKRPAISQWQGRATTDRALIESWWTAFPGALPGVELGRAGLVVVDLDRHVGAADGVAAFRALAAGRDLPLTPITRTASGGYHVYFRQPEGRPLGNGTGDLPVGCDVRGRGGWTVGVGSVFEHGAWRALADRPLLVETGNAIAELPPWMLDIIKPPVIEVRRAATTSRSTIRSKYFPDADKNALAGLVRVVAAAAIGERNTLLNWAAFQAREIVQHGEITADMVREVLIEAAGRCGLDRDEAIRTIASGLGE